MSEEQPEVILAQEQGTEMRTGGISKELKAEFGVGVKEGTLVLTSKRLIFVCTDDRGEELPVGYFAEHLLLYSEVEDLAGIPNKTPNVFIPLQAATVRGRKGELGRPSLDVSWKDERGVHNLVFTETLTGRRRMNLDDWASAIERIRSGSQTLAAPPTLPPADSLEWKVIRALADMQEKGVLQIEETVEDEYHIELDPDVVQAACDRLSAQRLLVRYPDPSGDVFYRKASPLDDAELSD